MTFCYWLLIGVADFNDIVIDYITPADFPESLELAMRNAKRSWERGEGKGCDIEIDFIYRSETPIFTHQKAQ
mgnify:CR=1 FL=1